MDNHSRPLPEPDYDDEKELYAFFGFAFYWVQVFEHSVMNLAAALHVGRVNAITQQFVDDLWENLDAMALGSLIKETRKLTSVPEDTDRVLSDLLKKRNFLAHHFFKARAEEILAHSGRKRMIDELRTIADDFRKGDKLVETIYLPLWARFGITKEVIAQEVKSTRSRIELEENGL